MALPVGQKSDPARCESRQAIASASHRVASPSTRMGRLKFGLSFDELFALARREGGCEFKLDRRVQIARHGNGETRIIVAAEIEFHGAFIQERYIGNA